MAWKLRGRAGGEGQEGAGAGAPPPRPPPLLPGGTPVLAGLCLGAVAIEVGRLADDLGGAVAEGGPASPAAVGQALADLAAADGLVGRSPGRSACD